MTRLEKNHYLSLLFFIKWAILIGDQFRNDIVSRQDQQNDLCAHQKQ